MVGPLERARRRHQYPASRISQAEGSTHDVELCAETVAHVRFPRNKEELVGGVGAVWRELVEPKISLCSPGKGQVVFVCAPHLRLGQALIKNFS